MSLKREVPLSTLKINEHIKDEFIKYLKEIIDKNLFFSDVLLKVDEVAIIEKNISHAKN